MKEDGEILVSIPNIGHNDILVKLFQNRFDYTSIGLLDNTHIHFWGEENLDTFLYIKRAVVFGFWTVCINFPSALSKSRQGSRSLRTVGFAGPT